MKELRTWYAKMTIANVQHYRERGQGLAEVALILALVVVVSMIALELLGTNISAVLTQVANTI